MEHMLVDHHSREKEKMEATGKLEVVADTKGVDGAGEADDTRGVEIDDVGGLELDDYGVLEVDYAGGLDVVYAGEVEVDELMGVERIEEIFECVSECFRE